jgi:hypothetical protein
MGRKSKETSNPSFFGFFGKRSTQQHEARQPLLVSNNKIVNAPPVFLEGNPEQPEPENKIRSKIKKLIIWFSNFFSNNSIRQSEASQPLLVSKNENGNEMVNAPTVLEEKFEQPASTNKNFYTLRDGVLTTKLWHQDEKHEIQKLFKTASDILGSLDPLLDIESEMTNDLKKFLKKHQEEPMSPVKLYEIMADFYSKLTEIALTDPISERELTNPLTEITLSDLMNDKLDITESLFHICHKFLMAVLSKDKEFDERILRQHMTHLRALVFWQSSLLDNSQNQLAATVQQEMKPFCERWVARLIKTLSKSETLTDTGKLTITSYVLRQLLAFEEGSIQLQSMKFSTLYQILELRDDTFALLQDFEQRINTYEQVFDKHSQKYEDRLQATPDKYSEAFYAYVKKLGIMLDEYSKLRVVLTLYIYTTLQQQTRQPVAAELVEKVVSASQNLWSDTEYNSQTTEELGELALNIQSSLKSLMHQLDKKQKTFSEVVKKDFLSPSIPYNLADPSRCKMLVLATTPINPLSGYRILEFPGISAIPARMLKQLMNLVNLCSIWAIRVVPVGQQQNFEMYLQKVPAEDATALGSKSTVTFIQQRGKHRILQVTLILQNPKIWQQAQQSLEFSSIAGPSTFTN